MSDFWVNAIGEYGRDKKQLGGGIDVKDISARAGKPWVDLSREERDKVGWVIYTERAALVLTLDEFQIFQLVSELGHLPSAIFRFNGGIVEGKPYVNLSFEFHVFTDDSGLPIRWQVYRYVEDELYRRRKLTVQDHVLHSGLYTDHKKVEDPVTHAWKDIFGKDHGRPFEQICFDVDVYTPKMAKSDVNQLMREIVEELVVKKLTEYTVNVL